MPEDGRDSRADRASSVGQAIEIAMGVDGPYLPFAATVMRSCLDHHEGSRLSFHLLYADSSLTGELGRVEEMVFGQGARLQVHRMDHAVVDGLPRSASFPPVVSMRLLLPRLLPDVPRVVYLDADVLVQASLGPLWSADLEGRPLGAVHNVVEPRYAPHIRAIGLEPGRLFNSGVLVMDLERMRRASLVDHLLDIAQQQSEELLWPDQEVLNLGFADQWKALHPRWNVQNSFFSMRPLANEVFPSELIDEAIERPAVRHFEGPWMCKPWHYLCREPSAELFHEALQRTPWRGEAVWHERTLMTRGIRRLPSAWQIPAYFRMRSLRSRLADERRRVAVHLRR